MTDQERQLIEGLVNRIHNAPPPQIDRDADDLIRRGIGSRQDALYILTQTVLIQEMALNQAKAQIDELKQRATSPQSNTSFLGNSPQPAGYQGSSYQRDSRDAYAEPAQPPLQYQQQAPPSSSGGRFSGFLHNAVQTAAGVVAGEVAFSALSSLFSGHGGGYGGGFGGGSGFFGGAPGISPGSETIVNNYYGDEREHSQGSGFGSSDGGLSPDLEDRRFAGDDASTTDNDTDDDTTDSDISDNDTNDNDTDDFSDDSSSYDDGSDSN